ncbi:HAMP domain-containing sensor histidine kinase [Prosthecobacter sp.]|uniref:sensor histidine kinase n=1 Tax=Prosthecobacter sp. TaxID=1965333 RepID=UPI002488B441|nr:HAMP domain-containing sensor histidine kinase [Prosthecobacter sp.]MDI1311883.1 HAMP domain-containing sensor histidine kinase [Prosthecobacter sp.]
MSRLRLPLYLKILLWFGVNLLVLALLVFGFLSMQFRMSLDWMFSGEAGERISAIGDSITDELSQLPEQEWPAALQQHGSQYNVTFALFSNSGTQVMGASVQVPAEVLPKLIDKRSPNDRPPPRRPPPGVVRKRPTDAPPKPRFMLRAGEPAHYWAGIHLDLTQQGGHRPLTLLMVSNTITGGGLFFDLWPWLGLAAAALLLSSLVWMPFVRSITGFIGQLNHAAGRIAQGNFGERVSRGRNDELGELSTSVNTMAAQLGEYVAQQRRITADVAHELCSPIARMQMALGVVEQRSTPEQSAYLQKLDAELQHMARLVEEVLAFSKAETLPERETAEDIHLHELITAVITREAPEADIQLNVATELQVHSLRDALDRAIGNILRNAARYAAESGPIQIHADQQNGNIVIRISDQGPGVSQEALPRLFEPFYRPEAARRRSTGGSGLGLAITRRCIEACYGSVTARLREPAGLEITIYIPNA